MASKKRRLSQVGSKAKILRKQSDKISKVTADSDRKIFRYRDGKTDRLADPLATWFAFEADPEFKINEHPAGMERGESEAMRIAIAAVRRVLGINPWADGGLTDLECVDLLMSFLDYMATLKKNGSGSPISPQPTKSASPEASPTNSV